MVAKPLKMCGGSTLFRCRSFNTVRLSIILLTVFFSTISFGETVRDLRYGVALYHFFQEDYYTALVEISAAQQQGLLENHQISGELLKGGMSLSYGLDKSAEKIFTRLLSKQKVDSDINAIDKWQSVRAWFYLGKMLYHQGEYPRAIHALTSGGKISSEGDLLEQTLNPVRTSIYSELIYLQAMMALQSGRFYESSQLMASVPPQSVFWCYYHFNVGAVFAKNGHWQKAIVSYEMSIGAMGEGRDSKGGGERGELRDRVNTAVGYAYLSNHQFDRAVDAFQRISIDGLFIDNALLGYGLAHSEQGQFIRALSPWQALRKKSLLLPSVQEVYLALPYTLEKIGRIPAALVEYERNAAAYRGEIAKLGTAITSYQTETLSELFELVNSADNSFSKHYLGSDKSASLYLADLVTKHSFQMALKDYRDIHQLHKVILQTEKRINLMSLVDGEQQDHWRELLAGGQLEKLYQRESKLLEDRRGLLAAMDAATSDKTGVKLLQGNNYAHWNRLKKAKISAQTLNTKGIDIEFEKELINRFEGLLRWTASEQYFDNRSQLQHQIKALDTSLVRTAESLAKISSSSDAVRRADSGSKFEQRLLLMREQTAIVKDRISTLEVTAEQQLRQLAIAELTNQKNQLRNYLSRTMLSIARLYDRKLEAAPLESKLENSEYKGDSGE